MLKYLDNHRFILILLILLSIVIIFLGTKSYLFLNHHFISLKFTANIDENYCWHKDLKILNNNSYKDEFFLEHKDEIEKLIANYNLPKFSNYTSYYYEVVSNIDYKITSQNEDIYLFFKAYNNTYDITNFFRQNTLFFEIFYPYKID